jgi:hypothetical protein
MIPIEFDSKLWIWQAEKGAWHFLTVPPEESDAIKLFAGGLKGGFGSVKVRVTIGSSTWKTSVFPSTERGGYILPVKKAVRTAEDLNVGDTAKVSLEVVI